MDDARSDRPGLAAGRLARRQAREELERRLEVMARNLDAIDPVSRWTGRPELDWTSPAILASLGAVGGGLLAAWAWHPGWGVVSACGAAVLAACVHSVAELREAHRKDLLTSLSNAQDIERLRGDMSEHLELLAHVDREDS